jgi:heat shock protein HslJ
VNDLVGKTWFLESITKGRAAPKPVLQGSSITIFFDPNGSFSGNAGCNNYAGSWALADPAGNDITLTMGQVSNMICNDPPGVMEQEQDYLTALGMVNSFAIGDDGSMSLYTTDQQILRYIPTGP